jgi:hypothetical protein
MPVKEPAVSNAYTTADGVEHVFVAGGGDGDMGEYGRQMYMFNSREELVQLPDMMHGRLHLAATVLEDELFVIGGERMIDVSANLVDNMMERWSIVPDTSDEDSEDKTEALLRSKVTLQEKTSVQMPFACDSNASVALGGMLWVIGGRAAVRVEVKLSQADDGNGPDIAPGKASGIEPSAGVWCFDPVHEQWHCMPPLPGPVGRAYACVL